MSATRASWLYVSQPTKLDEKHRGQIEQIRAVHHDLDTAYQLTQTFVSMLAEHQDTGLDDWLAQAEHSGIKELRSFAQGIRRDYAAVRATFTSEWSNGPVESQVNCLKLQKRLMFGRADFDLLRLRVLRRTLSGIQKDGADLFSEPRNVAWLDLHLRAYLAQSFRTLGVVY